MCIRDSLGELHPLPPEHRAILPGEQRGDDAPGAELDRLDPVSYTHLRAHETVLDLVCRLLLEKKNEGGHEVIVRTVWVRSKAFTQRGGMSIRCFRCDL